MSPESKRVAACLCGQLSITVESDPDIVIACNCKACQRRSGSPFGVGAYFPHEKIAGIKGEKSQFQRTAASGRWVRGHFCPQCGTTVYWTLEMRPGLTGIAAGCFADPDFPKPARAIWTESAHDWISFPQDMPRFEKAAP